MRLLIRLFSACLLLQIAACASAPPALENQRADVIAVDNAWTRAAQTSPTEGAPVWQHHHLPGKQATQYVYARQDGRDVIVNWGQIPINSWFDSG